MSCLNFSIDPRAHFCLTGIAVRIAQRMGLNYDGTTYGLPPFETEMRRRLWFQIMFLDNRVSELSGAGASVLNYIWTTKPPLNVNDSDLFPDMKDPPTESKRLTEMAYVLQRCEMVTLLQAVRSGRIGESTEEKTRAIDELGQRLDERYGKYCDPNIPLHLLTTLMRRCNLAKMSMGPPSSHGANGNSNPLSTAEKDRLFLHSLEMIESHTAMLGSPSLERFMWHITTNFPFPAHVFLLVALRTRTKGELVERAWRAFEEHYEKRMLNSAVLTSMVKAGNSPLHAAVANLTFKAWGARERDVPGAEVPRFVRHLMGRLNEKGRPKGEGEELSAMKGSPYFVVGKVPEENYGMVRTKTTNLPEEEEAQPISHALPFMWSNEQTPMQFDLAMGVNFDDEMMMDLTPSFGGNGSNGNFDWDPWSDFQPDAYGMAASTNNSFARGVDGSGFGEQFQ